MYAQRHRTAYSSHSGSIATLPDLGSCSLVPSLHSPAFFFSTVQKKSWGVETGNEAKEMYSQ